MKQLLNEKYRPKSLGDYVFKDDSLKAKAEQWVRDGDIPNLLFSGPPGTGKSSLSRMLINLLDIDESDIKIVNSSLESGIDLIRSKLEPWVTRRGFSKFKIILLEEFERISPDAQKALKSLTEDNSEYVRFIATSNNISKIDPALLSRFQHFELDSLDMDETIEFVVSLIENENITLKDDDDDALMTHIEFNFPDMRKIINSIDKHCIDGVLSPCEKSSAAVGIDAWDKIWESGMASESLTELLDLTEGVDAVNYEQYFTTVYENIASNVVDVPNAVIAIASHLERATRIANQRVNMDSLLYTLFAIED